MPLNPISLVASAARAAHVRVSGSVSGKLNFSAGARPGAKATYQSNGYTMNSSGYLAHPTHAAQVAANNAGALTRAEAGRMGLPLGGRR
jgi:hypothetical protein